MIGRIKQFLGIEGVKIRIESPDEIQRDSGKASGYLEFTSLHEQQVTEVRVRLIERYVRGRKKNKKIDEYILGTFETKINRVIVPKAPFRLPFELNFKFMDSEMDSLQHKGGVVGFMAGVAKRLYRAKSEYRLEATCSVKGTRVGPVVKKPVKFTS